MRLPTVKPIFAWYDFWVGAFIDRKKRRLYLLPLPCVGIVMEWPAPVVTKLVAQTHRHTLVLAYHYAQAREWARHHLPLHEDWRFCSTEEHLCGYRNVRLIKLDGWAVGKSREYIDIVNRLEAGL